MRFISFFLTMLLFANLSAQSNKIIIAIDMGKEVQFSKNLEKEGQSKFISNNESLNVLAAKYNLKNAYKIKQRHPFNNLDLFVLTFDENGDIENIITNYKNNSIIKFVENLNFDSEQNVMGSTEPSDPYFEDQNAFNIMQVPEAWDITTGSSDVIVAIIDSGLDWFHPDIKDNIYINPGEWNSNTSIDWDNGIITGDGIDNDNNGKIDDILGWHFKGSPNNSADDDNNPIHDSPDNFWGWGHGTTVAGVIGAVGNNETGITGNGLGCLFIRVKCLG